MLYTNIFFQNYMFKGFRYPGDITDGIINIYKRYISLNSFLLSYIKALFSRNNKFFELIRLNDLKYTFMAQIDNLSRFLKNV